MDKPANSHRLAGKRVLHYLQATTSLKFVYPRESDFYIGGEKDAEWNADLDGGRSTTGFSSNLGFRWGAVGWQIEKQQTVAFSACKTEYQGLAAAVQRATFLRSLLCGKGYQQMHATVIGEDNQSCVKVATKPVIHKR